MNTVTDMSYGFRLFIWLSANRLFPQPNDIDIDSEILPLFFVRLGVRMCEKEKKATTRILSKD